MRAIIYNRKSTKDKEDQQVLSIQGQKEENARKVHQGSYTLVAEYDEEQTAKSPGRPLFSEMMARIESGEADAIVCWRLNRLARNPIDGGRIQWLLLRGILKAIITSEKIYLPSDNVIQMSVEFGMATQYSIDLSKDVLRGMRQKAALGWKPGRPPLGYMRDDAGLKGAKIVREDPERFPLVRLMWEELLSRAFTVPQIWERAVERGLTQPGSRLHPEPKPLHLSTLYKTFTNPFYFGEFEWEGKTWTGRHRPMIDVRDFDRAQAILGRDGKPRNRVNENPYSGILRCGECGAMIVMDLKSKFVKSENLTRDYHYFRCAKNRTAMSCTQRGSLRRKEMEEQLTRLIDAAELPQSIIEWSLRKLRSSQGDKREIFLNALEHLQQEEQKAEAKINNLVDLRLENPAAFTPESFEARRKKLETELKDVKKKLRDREAAAKTWRDDVLESVEFLERVRERFRVGPREARLEICHRLGQTLELKDRVVTFRLAEPFLSFKEARDAVEEAVGSLEPLDFPLAEVKTEIFERAISVWSRFGDSNPGPTHYK